MCIEKAITINLQKKSKLERRPEAFNYEHGHIKVDFHSINVIGPTQIKNKIK